VNIFLVSAKTTRKNKSLRKTVEGFPFGGVGNSGIGSYHGKYSFYGMSHAKPILIRNYNPLAELLAK
jgi:acyl-CoA reductase-like NAD-dependent aldehyde dehydrogenase